MMSWTVNPLSPGLFCAVPEGIWSPSSASPPTGSYCVDHEFSPVDGRIIKRSRWIAHCESSLKKLTPDFQVRRSSHRYYPLLRVSDQRPHASGVAVPKLARLTPRGRRGGALVRADWVQNGGPSRHWRDEASSSRHVGMTGSMADEAIVCKTDRIYSWPRALSTGRNNYALQVSILDKEDPAEAGANRGLRMKNGGL